MNFYSSVESVTKVCIWDACTVFFSIHNAMVIYVPHVGTHDEASETDLTKIGKVTAGFHKDSSRNSAAECQGQ